MATSKTGSFWLTETIVLTDANETQGTLDLGAYVDVGDQQAISIEDVDFILQNHDTANDVYNNNMSDSVGANTAWSVQLSDLNPGTEFVRADDNNLIASAAIYLSDTDFVVSIGPDLFPDTFGKLDESRMVVNDSLYLVAQSSAAPNVNRNMVITARIKCRIVKLSTKDWMAIAIQSTAADN